MADRQPPTRRGRGRRHQRSRSTLDRFIALRRSRAEENQADLEVEGSTEDQTLEAETRTGGLQRNRSILDRLRGRRQSRAQGDETEAEAQTNIEDPTDELATSAEGFQRNRSVLDRLRGLLDEAQVQQQIEQQTGEQETSSGGLPRSRSILDRLRGPRQSKAEPNPAEAQALPQIEAQTGEQATEAQVEPNIQQSSNSQTTGTMPGNNAAGTPGGLSFFGRTPRTPAPKTPVPPKGKVPEIDEQLPSFNRIVDQVAWRADYYHSPYHVAQVYGAPPLGFYFRIYNEILPSFDPPQLAEAMLVESVEAVHLEPAEDIMTESANAMLPEKVTEKPNLLSLPVKVRFRIMEFVLERQLYKNRTHPVLLSPVNFIKGVYEVKHFMRMSEIFDAIEGFLEGRGSRQLRNEALAFIMTQFHFQLAWNPFTNKYFCPLGQQWFLLYTHQVMYLTIELDYTHFGGNFQNNCGALGDNSAKLIKLVMELAGLIEERATPLQSLTILCRRYKGNRPLTQKGLPSYTSPTPYTSDAATQVLHPLIAPLQGKIMQARMVGFDKQYSLAILGSLCKLGDRKAMVPADGSDVSFLVPAWPEGGVWVRNPAVKVGQDRLLSGLGGAGSSLSDGVGSASSSRTILPGVQVGGGGSAGDGSRRDSRLVHGGSARLFDE
jgi:hypothetical protein